MEDIEVLARIVLRQPIVLATLFGVGLLLAAVAWVSTRGRQWPAWRRVALCLSGPAFALLPATTLARHHEAIRWRMPYLAGDPRELLHLGLLTPTPENLLNMAMLVPFGFLAVLATRRTGVVLVATLLSVVVVELLQGAAGIGVVEIPDVAQNVGGCLLGATAARILHVVSHRIRVKERTA